MPKIREKGKSQEKKFLVSSADLINLRESGLYDETIQMNGLFTKEGKLHFPYRDLEGTTNCFARWRYEVPIVGRDGKERRYEQPRGSKPRAYFPVDSLAQLNDGTSDIYITEGEKKALAGSQYNLAILAIGGIWNGTVKNADGEYVLIDDLKAIPWDGRVVYIVFDYDDTLKKRRNALAAAQRLSKALKATGVSEVYFVELTPGPEGAKQGLDDFLLRNDQRKFDDLVERASPIDSVLSVVSVVSVVGPKEPEKNLSVVPVVSVAIPTLGDETKIGWVGEFLTDISDYTEATEAALLEQLLPAVGTYIGRGPRIMQGAYQPCRVNSIIVGPTSRARKGTALFFIKELMERLDKEAWSKIYRSGLATGEELIHAVTDKVKTDKEGNEKIIPVEKRMLAVEQEFSKVLAQRSRYGSILTEVIRQCYDDEDLCVMTKEK